MKTAHGLKASYHEEVLFEILDLLWNLVLMRFLHMQILRSRLKNTNIPRDQNHRAPFRK